MEYPIKDLRRTIKLKGGSGEVSRRMGVKQARLCNWLARGSIPAERIIPLCSALEWVITPHQLRPDLYPHWLDGMGEVAGPEAL
jgi:DNA-binding transcriptional regulator YdaS (Cro superfamily)